MQSDVRKYGNPRFLKEISNRNTVNSVSKVKEENKGYVSEYGQKSLPIPVKRKRRKLKPVSVYVNDIQRAKLKSISLELGMSESGTFKYLLSKFSNQRKKDVVHTQ